VSIAHQATDRGHEFLALNLRDDRVARADIVERKAYVARLDFRFGFLGASMTQTGTRRPSGMKMVLGTISSGLDANSFGSCHSVTNTRMLGQEYGLTSELSSRRTDVPWIFFFSFGQLSPTRIR
jgi:hypothetical protein